MATRHAAAWVLNRRQLLSFDPMSQPDRRQEPDSNYWVRISRIAMACHFEVLVAPEDKNGILAAQDCLDEIDRLESILSIFRPSSQASLLNCHTTTGSDCVGAELFELLQSCECLHKETEGAFDITAGVLSECWGFQQRQPRIPTHEALLAARERVGFHHITLGPDRTVSLSPGVRINFGGIGKGYALDRGASKMRAHGIETALLSAGFSSVLAMGGGSDGGGWLVGLRHPVLKNRRLGTVRLHSCAMATSGQEEQCFEVDGRRYGHILDPRTGFPADKVASVSVIAESAAHADALTTAFFVGGPELAESYCAMHEGVVAVMLLAHDLTSPVVFGSSDRTAVEIFNE